MAAAAMASTVEVPSMSPTMPRVAGISRRAGSRE
jgi:hypothetical protein